MTCLKNDKGDSMLHLAAAFGHLELVDSMISYFGIKLQGSDANPCCC